MKAVSHWNGNGRCILFLPVLFDLACKITSRPKVKIKCKVIDGCQFHHLTEVSCEVKKRIRKKLYYTGFKNGSM
jgi:hypothetical protein